MSYLDSLIHWKSSPEQVCKILQEIWVEETIIEEDKWVIMEDSDEEYEDQDSFIKNKKGKKGDL